MVIGHDGNLNTYGSPLTKDNYDVMKFLILGRPKINLIYVLIIRIPPCNKGQMSNTKTNITRISE